MVGQAVSHYQILKQLGAGGMGEVYLARDNRPGMGREVALKVLGSRQAEDPEARERFLRESQTQARLGHPNIATFFDVGEEDGIVFIAMERLTGGSLADLVKSQEVGPSEALEIAIQIGDALAHAHDSGVVHRDVSAGNVLLTHDGRAKLTDFGLAHFKGRSSITKTGTVMGTPHYISPEQAEGKKSDHRGDLFSLGVILYELLCHRRPFEGAVDAVVLHEVMFSDPQPPARYCRDLPDSLQHVVLKALAKKPQERYQSAADFVADLRHEQRVLEEGGTSGRPPRPWWQRMAVPLAVVLVFAVLVVVGVKECGERPPVRTARLVVLPFENLGPAEREYIADGITDEIITGLARAGSFAVISRTSAMQYKDTEKSIAEIAADLDVDYVLEGAIHWGPRGDTIRIAPQLICTDDDTHLWAESYDRAIEQLFAVQSEIASEVARALGELLGGPPAEAGELRDSLFEEPIELVGQPAESDELIDSLPAEPPELVGQPVESGGPTEIVDAQAYDLYLRGNDYFYRGIREGDLKSAIMLYENAIFLDSSFAPAWAKLSRAHASMYHSRYDRSTARRAASRDAARTALNLNPDLPEAHLAMGFYHYWGRLNYDAALRQFTIVRRSEPNNADVHGAMAAVSRRQGRFSSAADGFKRAAALDPRSMIKMFEVGNTYYHMRRCDSADFYFDRAIALAPDMMISYSRKILNALSCDGDTRQAWMILQEAERRVDHWTVSYLRYVLDMMDGDFAAAAGDLPRDRPDPGSYQLAVAQIRELQGDTEAAGHSYDSARVILESQAAATPEDAMTHSALGAAYAGLGRVEDAVREGERAVAMRPLTVDAFRGAYLLEELAGIYATVGQHDRAIDLLDTLLTIPSQVSAPRLRIDPAWIQLRDHLRFRALLAEHDK